jgi:hypothetical protein
MHSLQVMEVSLSGWYTLGSGQAGPGPGAPSTASLANSSELREYSHGLWASLAKVGACRLVDGSVGGKVAMPMCCLPWASKGWGTSDVACGCPKSK